MNVGTGADEGFGITSQFGGSKPDFPGKQSKVFKNDVGVGCARGIRQHVELVRHNRSGRLGKSTVTGNRLGNHHTGRCECRTGESGGQRGRGCVCRALNRNNVRRNSGTVLDPGPRFPTRFGSRYSATGGG